MSDGPTRAEFTAFVTRCYDTMDQGFEGVNTRLDVLNGRTVRLEVADGMFAVRMAAVEDDLQYHGPRRRRSDQAGNGEQWAGAVTKREGALIGFGLVILTVILKVLEVVGTKLWDVLTHKP